MCEDNDSTLYVTLRLLNLLNARASITYLWFEKDRVTLTVAIDE